jgi:WD40 repeat protein
MTKINVSKLHSFSGHRDSIYTLAPGPTSSLFYSGAGDGMVVGWDLSRPDEGTLLAKLPHSVYALHLHSQTGLLIAGHNYEGIHLLHPESKAEVGSLKMTNAAIFDIASAGDRLFIADGAGVLTVVDAPSLRILTRLALSEKSLRTLAIDHQRGHLAVGGSDHQIRILGLDDLQEIYALNAHENSVFTLQYSPGSQYLLSGSRDARLGIWDVQAGYAPREKIVAHMYAINHLTFSPDGRHFVTASMDKSVKIWDAQSLRLLKVIDKGRHAGHGTSVNKVLWTDHRQQLLSASDDRTISVWNIQFE